MSYESLCLRRDLLSLGYKKEDIEKSGPTFPYRLNGKQNQYYPDVYMPAYGIVIVAKSDSHDPSEELQAKLNAVQDSGYQAELWTYNNKGEHTPHH